MKRELCKKLQLNKQTVTILTDGTMIHILGGQSEGCTNQPPTEDGTMDTCGKPILW